MLKELSELNRYLINCERKYGIGAVNKLYVTKHEYKVIKEWFADNTLKKRKKYPRAFWRIQSCMFTGVEIIIGEKQLIDTMRKMVLLDVKEIWQSTKDCF